MSKFSRHIKQDSIRNIILQDGPCKDKLSELRTMVGLPPAVVDGANKGVDGEGPSGVVSQDATNENPGTSLHDDSINRILEGLSGRELTMGKNLLIEIEKTPGLSWDQNTLEMILDDKTISFSNMNLLVNKVIQSTSNTIPLGLVTFLNALILNKIPMSYIRDGDSKNIRQALIEIKGQKLDEIAPVVPPTPNVQQGEENVEEVGETSNSVPLNEEHGGTKRSREDFEENDLEDNISEEQFSKKQKVEVGENVEQQEGTLAKKGRKKKTIVDPSTLRRSARSRLKKELQPSWRGLGT